VGPGHGRGVGTAEHGRATAGKDGTLGRPKSGKDVDGSIGRAIDAPRRSLRGDSAGRTASRVGRPVRTDVTVSDVSVAAVKSAFVTDAAPNSAAVGRLLGIAGTSELAVPQVQQAPPTNAKPSRRTTAAGEAGPLSLGAGTLRSHARWEPGMACGATAGDVTRADATLRAAEIAPAAGGALVAVPGKGRSLSTTALERHAGAARTVATASVDTRRIDLFGGAVRLTVEKPPTLMTSMSTSDGGEVRYVPAVVTVSGEGVDTAELSAAGDSVELALDGPGGPRAESGPVARWRSGARRLAGGGPLSLPTVPDVPSLAEPEAARIAGPGMTLRISIGDVRQATDGHAIAARASALTIALTRGATDRGYGGRPAGVVLDLDVGVLESASVAPEPSGAGGGVRATADDLPVTGTRVDLLALAGVGLLIAGTAALVFGLRKRRFRA
jgi:LPXTG-motif cell wall-anchored protein